MWDLLKMRLRIPLACTSTEDLPLHVCSSNMARVLEHLTQVGWGWHPACAPHCLEDQTTPHQGILLALVHIPRCDAQSDAVHTVRHTGRVVHIGGPSAR